MKSVQTVNRYQPVVIRQKLIQLLAALERLGGVAYPYEIVGAIGSGSYTGCFKRLKLGRYITISNEQVVTITEPGRRLLRDEHVSNYPSGT